MDPFLDLYWNLDQIVVWAETRDPEIVRVAAIPKECRPRKSLNLLAHYPHASLCVLGVERDVEGELWAASKWKPSIREFVPATGVRKIAEQTGRPAYEVFSEDGLFVLRPVSPAANAFQRAERRDRAVIAFAILSGARDDAIASMLMRHVNSDRRTVFHDARDVRTKNRKTFTSTFFPVGTDIESIVAEWISFLTKERLYGPDDPLFPSTRVEVGATRLFEATGLDRVGWRNAAAIRRIFRQAFDRVGLPYFNPHSFRKTLGALGEKLCTTPEQFKAWSQNLAHENVLATFTSYGTVTSDRQADILTELSKSRIGARDCDPDERTVHQVSAYLQKKALLTTFEIGLFR